MFPTHVIVNYSLPFPEEDRKATSRSKMPDTSLPVQFAFVMEVRHRDTHSIQSASIHKRKDSPAFFSDYKLIPKNPSFHIHALIIF